MPCGQPWRRSPEPWLSRLRLLIAYPYLNAKAVDGIARMGSAVELMVDSGAFTAWQSGRPIVLQEYIAFLKALPVRPHMYVALDVIGDPVRTRQNYLEMRAQGLQPVPVWTRGDSPDALAEYASTSPVVCIGGLVRKGQTPVPYLMRMRDHLAKQAVHLLGVNRLSVLKALRPYSCDSSNYTGALRYGRCELHIGGGVLQAFQRSNLVGRISPAIASGIARLGYDIADLRKDGSWRGGRSLAARITVASHVAVSAQVRANLGTRMYLSGSVDLDMVWNEYSRLRGRLPAAPEDACV